MGIARRLFSNEIVGAYNTGRELEEKSDRTDFTSAAFCGPLRPDDLYYYKHSDPTIAKEAKCPGRANFARSIAAPAPLEGCAHVAHAVLVRVRFS